jgi:hypothetical protein
MSDYYDDDNRAMFADPGSSVCSLTSSLLS